VKGDDIAERLLAVGAASLRVARGLPRDVGSRHVATQLVRAATGAGANYAEARAAESRADFSHKLGLAAKEMREALFWLGLVRVACLARPNLTDATHLEVVERESHELLAILMASRRTASRTP
jgi:four helix bundle protein